MRIGSLKTISNRNANKNKVQQLKRGKFKAKGPVQRILYCVVFQSYITVEKHHCFF